MTRWDIDVAVTMSRSDDRLGRGGSDVAEERLDEEWTDGPWNSS